MSAKPSKIYGNAIFVNHPDDMPTEPHFAILRSSTRDDGYGGRSPCWDYEAYMDEADWTAAIQKLQATSYGSSFKALRVQVGKVVTTVKVE